MHSLVRPNTFRSGRHLPIASIVDDTQLMLTPDGDYVLVFFDDESMPCRHFVELGPAV